MSQFWINKPEILIDYEKLTEVWPTEKMTFIEKLNSISRLIILLTVIGFLITRNYQIILTGVITLGVIIFLYYGENNKQKEGFTLNQNLRLDPIPSKDCNNTKYFSKDNFYKLKEQNPLGNVLLPEIGDDPQRKNAPPTFNESVQVDVNNNTKDMVKKLNPTIPDLDEKLFRDLGDNFQFENSMIHFNSTPNTSVPNDQKSFAEFCYGNMKSCKDTSTPIYCIEHPPRISSSSVYN